VCADYQVGRALAEAGVIVGGDLTAEAAMAKLAVILGQRTAAGWSHAEQVARVRAPIRGEMSGP
jgi:L-asparaginase/Glu-tRNA(Gln) amidotransferase subunit D